MRNKLFAKEVKEFIQDCKAARIEPTARQASKYLNGRGKAYKAKIERIREEMFKLK